jgi:hypothetical protein
MPINQAHELMGKYKQMKLDAEFDVVYGAGHGGDIFFEEAQFQRALAFLNRVIGK